MANNQNIFEESGGKLLTFKLNNQEYGITILNTREVVGMQPIDPVPKTPDFMKGVLNLRGKIIPIIDLRKKFLMSEKEYDNETCIIVADMSGVLTGLIVDQLIGVVTAEKDEYEEAPKLGNNINANYINGMIKLENRVIIVLNLENVLENEELEQIAVEK